MKQPISLVLLFALVTGAALPARAMDVAASVLTQHNDNHRTGAYLHETELTPATVSSGRFGRVAEFPVDGVISAQPLYVAGLDVPGTPNAAFIATNNNSIYRLLQDRRTHAWSSQRLWHRPGAVTMPGMLNDTKLTRVPPKPCLQTRWPVGIVSTPVIDAPRRVMYFVYRTGTDYTASATWPDTIAAAWTLAAIDIRDGHSVLPAVRIADANGDFAPEMQLNRPGLLLANGVVYVGFGAAVCDSGGNPNIPDGDRRKRRWHGWMFAYDAATLRRLAALNTSPAGAGAGIWQSGNGPAADDDGFVYATTGNNVLAAGTPAGLGESFLRLRLQRDGSFAVTPFRVGNAARLDSGLPHPADPTTQAGDADADLGAGGPLVLPNGFITGGGKQGSLYVIGRAPERRFRQGFQAFYNSWHPEVDPCDYDSSQSYGPNIHGAPVLWRAQGATYSWLYGMPEKDYLSAFRVDPNGRIEEHPGRTTVDVGERSPDGMPGGFLSISANGGRDGIVWASVGRMDAPDGSFEDITSRLVAFDATTLAPLWSDERPEWFTKFVPPTIAGGAVFRAVAAQGSQTGKVIVYGLGTPRAPVVFRPRITRSAPGVRQISAAWRTPNHLDLFASTLASGHVVSTAIGNPRGTPPEFPACPAGWRGWYPVAPSAAPLANASPVTALWRNAARLDLFTTSSTGGVMTTSWRTTVAPAGRWSGAWHAVPGTPAAPPGAAVTALWRTPQHLDVFVAAGGAVHSTWYDDGGWRRWFTIDSASGKAVSGAPVTAVWRDAGHLDLFMSDVVGHVVSTFFERDAWQPSWFPLGPATGIAAPGAPVTAVWRDRDHLDLFLTDVAGHVVSTFFDRGRWQPAWFALDPAGLRAKAGQRVTAVWRDRDHLDLFVVDANGVVRSTFFEHGAWQPHWFTVGSVRATPGQPVTALWRDARHLDLFLTAANGRVMSAFWEPNGGWRDWFGI